MGWVHGSAEINFSLCSFTTKEPIAARFQIILGVYVPVSLSLSFLFLSVSPSPLLLPLVWAQVANSNAHRGQGVT